MRSPAEGLPIGERALLDALESLAESIAADDLPPIALHLKSGRELTGVLLKMSHEGGTTLLLRSKLDRFEEHLRYVPLGSVEAITLLAPESLRSKLDAKRPAPTKLEVNRRSRALGERLATLVGHPVQVNVNVQDDGRWAGAAVDLLGDVLLEIAGDELGKRALLPFFGVRLERGALSAARHQDTFVVTLPEELPSSGSLKACLEAAL